MITRLQRAGPSNVEKIYPPAMPHPSAPAPERMSPPDIADEISRVLARFPLIVRVLGELQLSQIPFPGDDDIRHGCDRALTSMLSELARIKTAPGKSPSTAVESTRSILANPAARGLVDADKLQRMQLLLDSILQPPTAA